MSRTTVLGVSPDHRPTRLIDFANAWGWSPSIWGRLTRHLGLGERWDSALDQLWRLDGLPEWADVALCLTYDTGVIPYWDYEWAADGLDEFDRRLPEEDGRADHLPAVAALLRSLPEAPFVGVWGTSVTDNPFDPWDEDLDDYAGGIGLRELYIMPRHRERVLAEFVHGVRRPSTHYA